MTNPRLLLCLAALVALARPLAAEEWSNEKSVQELRLDKFVMPEFPGYVRATENGRGVVTVAIGRDAEGRVNDVLVLDSTHARLSQSVVAAVQEWKFKLPANPPPRGRAIHPIVRFVFGAKGVVVVSALTGSLAAKDRDVKDNAPLILPSFADLDSEPKPLNHPMPRFTGAAAERVAGGTATIKYFVDETGKVRVPIVVDCTSPAVGHAALAAVEQWTFEPPRIAGRPTIALEVGSFTFGTAAQQ
jgi:TonB family protein